MEGERILRCVKSANVDNLVTSVQAYLGPVLCPGGRDTKDAKYEKFSRKLLKECIDQHKGGDNQASSELLDSASVAIECLKKLSPEASSGDRLFEKLLFNFARECFSVAQYQRGVSAAIVAFERLNSPRQGDVTDFMKQIFNLLWSAALKADETASLLDLCLDMKGVALQAALRAGLQWDFVLPRALKADIKHTRAAGEPASSSFSSSANARCKFHSLLVSRLSTVQSSDQDSLPCKTFGLYVEELLRFSAALRAVRSAKDSDQLVQKVKTLLKSHSKRGCCSKESAHACSSARAVLHTTELVASIHFPSDSALSAGCTAKLLEELCSAMERVVPLLSDKTVDDLDMIGRLCDSVDFFISALEKQRQQSSNWCEMKCFVLSRKTFDLLKAIFGSYVQLRCRLWGGMHAKGGSGCGSTEVALKCKHLYILNLLQDMLVDLLMSNKESCVDGDKTEKEGKEEEEEEEEIEIPRNSSMCPPPDPKMGLVSLCLPLLEESCKVLRGGTQCGVPEEEHRVLGGSAYNLGVVLHRCGAATEAVQALCLACEEMRTWCSTKEGRMMEVNLLEKQCLLASYQREISLFPKALDTLTQAALTAASTRVLEDSQKRCALVRQWAKIRMAALDAGVTDVEDRTFMSALKPLKQIPLSTVSSCLEAELREYKEQECDGALVHVVDELMEVYTSEGKVLDRTRMLIEQAILSRKKGDRRAVEFFTDIVGILESLKKSEKINNYTLTNQLATTNFWKAVCIYDQLMERCEKSASSSPSLPPPSSEDTTVVDIEDQLCLTPEEGKVLLSSDSIVRYLEVAVDHWHTMSHMTQRMKNCDLSHDWCSFEVMTVASYMCVTHHRPSLAVKTLAALVQMYEASPSPSLQAQYHNALAMKARLLSGCGVPPEVAASCLEPLSASEVPLPSSVGTPGSGKAGRALVTSMLHAKLSLAAIKLTNDELDSCRSLLVEVLSHPYLTTCYPSSYVLQARAKLLASSLLQHRPSTPVLTPAQVLDHLESSPATLLHPHFTLTPLELAMDALRLFQGVVSGDAQKKGEEVQKRVSVEVRGWELFEGVLEGLKTACEVHCLCGMVREAYHYAREGLKLAKSKALRCWTITFYLILAKILIIKDNFPMARKLLCQAGQLFDPVISLNSTADVFRKVVQSCPTHLQQCIDLIMVAMQLEDQERGAGKAAPPPLIAPQDLPQLLSSCASLLDTHLSLLCGSKSSPKQPWFSRTPSYLCAEQEGTVLLAQAHSRAEDFAKCLALCRQSFGQAKKQVHSTDPRYWQLIAHTYVVAGACVVTAKEAKTKVKLTKQDDPVEYFLMALQLCFPYSSTLLLREVCLWLSSLMAEASPLLASHFLSFSMQLTLTHQAMYSIGCKLRKHDRGDIVDVIATLQRNGPVDATHAMKARQSFPPLDTIPPVAYTRVALDSLPLSWTLCTLAVDPGERYLLVMRGGRDKDPLLVRIDLPAQNIPEAHQQCLMSSKDSLAIKDKKKWWAVRRELDSSLETLCGDIEDQWLGYWKCLLVGKAADDRTSVVEQVHAQLKEAVDRKWVELLVETWGCLSQEEVCLFLGEVADDHLTAAQKKQVYSTIEDLTSGITSPHNHPVILIAGHTLQCLPWESIPVLRDRPVCRMPSLAFLVAHRHMSGHDGCGLVNPLSTFYVLNPEKNLPKTEKCFEWFTKEPGWEGLVGEEPNNHMLKAALEQHQLYIYCGHGSGGKYLNADQLHLVHCKAASLLMGCSSGKLAVHGNADPTGVVLQYLISGCPAVVANLWDVTDEDIDRYLECLLDNWLSGAGEPLLNHTSSARSVCKLKYLIGASPVVYGIPMCVSE